jgi:hypothetical protein
MPTPIQTKIEEEVRKLDEKFPGWKNTKFDILKTGEIEYVTDKNSPVITGGREEIKSFLRQSLTQISEEATKLERERIRKHNEKIDMSKPKKCSKCGGKMYYEPTLEIVCLTGGRTFSNDGYKCEKCGKEEIKRT